MKDFAYKLGPLSLTCAVVASTYSRYVRQEGFYRLVWGERNLFEFVVETVDLR